MAVEAKASTSGKVATAARPRAQTWYGLAALAAAVAVTVLYGNIKASLAVMWVFGLGYGFVLQRSRFCFASTFRDLFLLRDARMVRGVIVGLLVATVGFSLLMYRLVPDAAAGQLPAGAGVHPLGWFLVLGGFLFGVGMVVAGGCASGTLYRMGEGYVAQWVALLGMLLGSFLLALNYEWWWNNAITRGAEVWFPQVVGWPAAIILTVLALLLFYFLAWWWESRAGGRTVMSAGSGTRPETFREDVSILGRKIFVYAWPVVIGGLLLGLLNVFQYMYSSPWGITTEVSRWAGWLFRLFGYSSETLLYFGPKPAGKELLKNIPWFSNGGLLNFGLIFGAFVAALCAGEFKIRVPRQKVRLVQSLIGGVLMGYGSRLANGCNIGAFFSAIPSLALNGWVFGVGLVVGAYVGTQIIRRIA